MIATSFFFSCSIAMLPDIRFMCLKLSGNNFHYEKKTLGAVVVAQDIPLALPDCSTTEASMM